MLLNLHVKNFALIEEADIDFGSGLNILTGETGAGKSLLIDAVNAALGGRLRGDVIRSGCDSAYTELVFSVPEEEKREALSAMDVSTEYECIVISRRILPGRSVHKINDETVTSAKVRQVTAFFWIFTDSTSISHCCTGKITSPCWTHSAESRQRQRGQKRRRLTVTGRPHPAD